MKYTIIDVANKAKVSTATVSRVLNDSKSVKEDTRLKVLKAIDELDYTPNAIARTLSKNESELIGVVIPDINNPFFGEVIKGVTNVTEKNNLNIILANTQENLDIEKKYLNILKNHMLKGLIITPTSDTNDINNIHLNFLENLGVKIVLVDRGVKYSNFSSVLINNYNGGYKATKLLIDNGHKNIAIISGNEKSIPGRERLQGYIDALSDNGINIKNENIYIGNFTKEGGYECTNQILRQKDRPTAIFVTNNMMTLGSLKSIIEHNLKISEDICIIGFDKNEILDDLGLSITHVSRPMLKMGEIATEILIREISSDNSLKENIVLEPKIVLNGTEKFK